jgi:hypothetical protein
MMHDKKTKMMAGGGMNKDDCGGSNAMTGRPTQVMKGVPAGGMAKMAAGGGMMSKMKAGGGIKSKKAPSKMSKLRPVPSVMALLKRV